MNAGSYATCALLGAILLCYEPAWGSAAVVDDEGLRRLAAKLESLRTKWDVPGMSAAVAEGNQIVWERGFGFAKLETKQPATKDTVYHLASLTKPFASVVLLQSVDEGKLDLDAPVTQFGITLKSDGTIRVRHLLTHTSEGIPGETFRYSGERFRQLDNVLTGATGASFAKLLSERVLNPLGLTNTAPNPFDVQSCVAAGRDAEEFRRRLAEGYNSSGRVPEEYKKHFVTAAGLVSTVGDVAWFSIALDNDQLMQKQTKERAFSPAIAPSGERLAYGLGWFVNEEKRTKIVWHYGWWNNNSSLIVKIPERKLTFVLLANSNGLSRKFDLGKDNDVRRSPFARVFLEICRL